MENRGGWSERGRFCNSTPKSAEILQARGLHEGRGVIEGDRFGQATRERGTGGTGGTAGTGGNGGRIASGGDGAMAHCRNGAWHAAGGHLEIGGVDLEIAPNFITSFFGGESRTCSSSPLPCWSWRSYTRSA
jgi:hypothetical protein